MPAMQQAAVGSPRRTDRGIGALCRHLRRTRRRMLPLLTLGLLAATAQSHAAGTQAAPAVLDAASKDTRVAHNPLWLVALGDLSATTQRPIFAASRRPPVPRAIAVAPVRPPPPAPVVSLPEHPALVLIGTIIGPSLQTGVFREETSDRIVKLSTGGGRDGWTLRSVSRRDARFEMADRTAVLPLRPSAQPMPQGKSAFPATGQSRRREWYDN
ncbi:hypothetical protein IC762_18785 [Bradyrhizobium genosp. L]|uniref:hypothetical protein n=1 Tax=Bradyrhizobium genosp. L TaxID=83637 RepID=UPI0018A3279B|nr:hypothetical protein [Bradyrhizobium genosp. L]QPF81851.1 hypothetical protein IC762_18785 [Bradyrhizobium genosp. L]